MCECNCMCWCCRKRYFNDPEEMIMLKLGMMGDSDRKKIMKKIQKDVISYALFKLLVEQEKQLRCNY